MDNGQNGTVGFGNRLGYYDPQALGMLPTGMVVGNQYQYHMMAMPMAVPGMPPQLPGVYSNNAQAAKTSNIYFKTRLCNKWRSGNCPYGDKCTYAHGQHELRYVPPELLAQYEQEQQQQQVNGDHMGPPPPLAQQHSNTPPGSVQDGDQQDRSKQFFKTRLCIKFMQTGYCVRGASCTFAHGYYDLHPAGGAGANGYPGPAQGMMYNGGGRPGYPGMAPYPMPPQMHTADGRGMNGNGHFHQMSPEVQKARGMSAIAEVGKASAAADDEAYGIALDAVNNGSAFSENVYGESVEN